MTRTPGFLTEKIRDDISAIGRKYDLRMILLHGSYADGTAEPGSDLDIAILGREELTLEEFMSINRDLTETLGNNAERELDLKTLHRADPLFCYEVGKKSCLLYGEQSDYNSFLAYAYAYYMDSKDLFSLEKALILKFQRYLNEKYLNEGALKKDYAA